MRDKKQEIAENGPPEADKPWAEIGKKWWGVGDGGKIRNAGIQPHAFVEIKEVKGQHLDDNCQGKKPVGYQSGGFN